MHKVCAKCLVIPNFGPELESRFAEHRRAANVKGLRFAAPLLLVSTIAFNFVSSWEECSLFYRLGILVSAITALIGFMCLMVKSIPLWVSDSTIAVATFMYAAHSFFTYFRLGAMLGTDCGNSDYDDEMEGPFSVSIVIHAWSHLLQPSQESMRFIALLCPAVYVLLILTFGTHQAAQRMGRAYFNFLIFIFCVFEGSYRYEKERRRKFLDITGHQTSWSNLWHALQHASVPVAVFGAGDNTVAGEAGLESTQLSVQFWNDAFYEYTEQQVVPDTPFNDVVTLAHESASELKDAVLQAIDPALRKTTKQMLTQLVTPKGPVWLQLDIWPVTTASAGFQAMVIGSDVSEFITAHQSLLQKVQPEQDESPRAGAAGEQEQDECRLVLKGAVERSQPVEVALPPRSASADISALLHGEDCVLSQCTAALSVFFNRLMEGVSLLPYVLSPERKEILDAVGRVLEGSGSEQLPVHMFSPQVRGRRWKKGWSRKLFLQFHDAGLGHSNHVRVAIIPECRLHTVSEADDNEVTETGICGLGGRTGESEPDIGPAFTSTPMDDDVQAELPGRRRRVASARAGSGTPPHPETGGQRQVLPSRALQMRKTAVETYLFHLTCHLPEATQAEAVCFLLAALGEVQKPRWAKQYRRCTGWLCGWCKSHNFIDDDECAVCAHGREASARSTDRTLALL